MGIVFDKSRSSIVFEDPLFLRDPFQTFNDFEYTMYSWTTTFGIGFDPDPKVGVGGAPSGVDIWQIGIVQNVLYERLTYEFEDTKPFVMEEKQASVDALSSSTMIPFYGDPVTGRASRNQRPAVRLALNSTGYGELTDPSNVSSVNFNNKPDAVDMWDEPSGGARFRLENGKMISKVEKVVTFQAWLVARSSVGTVTAMAHVPMFTVGFWWEATQKSRDLRDSLARPTFNYGYFANKGRFHAKYRRKPGDIASSPDLELAAGDGGLKPVTSGTIMLGTSDAFMAKNDLVPPPLNFTSRD